MTEKIKLQRVNDEEVKAIPFKRDERPVKGANIASKVYSNFFLVAHKHSGKTTVIRHILDKCAGKTTEFLGFISTIHIDDAWKHQIKEWEAKDRNFTVRDSLIDEETGVNQLSQLMKDLQKEDEKEEEDGPLLEFKEKIDKKRKKSKLLYPERFLIFDDLSDELKGRTIATLLKKNRHYKSKVIISSQGLKDIVPTAREQIDVWLLWKDLSDDILKTIKADAGLRIPFEKLKTMYEFATSKPYGFLYIDKNGGPEYRMNFTSKFETN